MSAQFKRTLSKQISHLKATLANKEAYSPEDVAHIFSEFQAAFETSFSNHTEANNQKLTQSKNILKKTNKAFAEYKILSEQKQLQLAQQNQDLRKQLERSKRKVHELLKNSQKHQQASSLKEEKTTFEKGIQCHMKDQQMEDILEAREKQNISLKQRICELQQQVESGKQDVETANVLIKELVRQLETNIADRETWNGTGSSNASELDSLDRLDDDSDESFQTDSEVELSERMEGVSEISVCRPGGPGGPGEDCSTVDGSNTTNKDYALPEWLQFGQTTPNFTEMEEEQRKMWPQLLWNRLRQLMGKSFEI